MFTLNQHIFDEYTDLVDIKTQSCDRWSQKTIDPLNHVTTYEYDEADNVRNVTDANNNTTTYDYDKLNRQIEVKDANSIITQTNTYDGFGNVRSIQDASGNITRYEYDKLVGVASLKENRLTKTIDPRSKETTQAYDGLGRVLSIRDRNNLTRTFAYDINDNLLTETWGGTTQLTYTYDKVSNLKSSSDASSNTTNTYGYDAIYQLTSAATSNSNVKFEYDYDELGDRTQRRDKDGTLTIATLDYLYNNNHQLTRLTQSGVGLNTQTIEMSYDRLSQLKQVKRAVASNPGLLITDYGYDGAGRLLDITNKFNSTVISNYNYGYDDGNRLSGKDGTDGTSSIDYGRDNQISAVDNATRPDEAYSFDALGIRTGWTTDAVDKRRVLSDGIYLYQYDDEGNLTRKEEISTGKVTAYVWDYRNRLTRVNLSDGSTVEYGYDAEDRRVSKKLNGVTKEKYVYDGDDIALVVDAGGTIVERYLYGDGVDNVLSRTSAAGVVWSLADRQGSVVDLVDEGGNVLNHFVYDSFGNRTATTAADFRFGYTGRELDAETGLYYYRARYYDPQLGRFISEDPIGFSAGDTNLYRYVNNSPTNWTDPTGTTISGWADDALNAADSFFAGFADATTFGLSSKLRERWYGKLATANHQGGFFVAGSLVGAAAGFALGFGGERAASSLVRAGIRAYDTIDTSFALVQGVNNVATGNASGWDLLNFAPAAGFVAANRRAIGGALMNAGDNAADAAWRLIRGGELQPQLIPVGQGGAIRATNGQSGTGFQHFFASSYYTNRDGWIEKAIQKGGNPLNELNYANLNENIIKLMKENNVVLKQVPYNQTKLSKAARQYRIDNANNPDLKYTSNVASVRFKDKDGAETIFSYHSRPNNHTERLLLQNEEFLNQIGGRDNFHNILEFYTEFQPCNLPGGKCIKYLVDDSRLANIEISYSFIYTDYVNELFGRNIRNYDKGVKRDHFRTDAELTKIYPKMR